MDAVARRSGVSKGGLIHHFPSRTELLLALVQFLAAETSADFEARRVGGSAARVWLETSTPDSADLDSFFVMVLAMQALRAAGEPLPGDLHDLARDATTEIARELPGPHRALVVRLVGDGLLFNAMIGDPIDPEERDDLIAHLTGG